MAGKKKAAKVKKAVAVEIKADPGDLVLFILGNAVKNIYPSYEDLERFKTLLVAGIKGGTHHIVTSDIVKVVVIKGGRTFGVGSVAEKKVGEDYRLGNLDSPKK